MMIFNYSHGESDMREKRLVGCALSFPPLYLFTILSSNFYNSLLSLALFSKQNSTSKNISRNSTTLDHHHNTNMDPSPHQNWLAFSLSNYSHQLSLFQNNPSGAVTNENESATTDHLPLLLGADGGPKLEDFLGSSGGGATGEGVAQFSDHAALVQTYDDLELKNIAASFLHGYNKNVDEGHMQLAVVAPPEPPAKKAVETYGQRTSIFRGVTRHRWTGRYEAHLWDNSCRREGQSRKGRQVYLGGYDKEEKAARAYDLAALKYWGPTTTTNFPVSDYEKEVEEMKNMTRQEFVASLRRKSSGFSRGASIYRGVTRHHQHGRWQARIGRVAGNKDLYLGTFSTQEEAAEAYDIAAIKFRGLNAVTNFDMSRYDAKSIASSNLPVGGVTNKSKTSSESQSGDNRSVDGIQSDDSSTKDLSVSSIAFPSQNSVPALNFSMPIKQDQSSSLWAAIGYQHPTLVANDPSNMSPISQGTTPLCMEFQPSPNNCDNENIYGVGGYYQLQERGIDCTSSGSGGSVALSGTDGTNDELTYGNGNWIPQSIHPFQTTKSNLSEFQTPIFGLERI